MDRMLYVALSGAKHTMLQQETVANNLANLSTTGFRADINSFRSVIEQGYGEPTRTFVANESTGVDFAPGAIQQTGNPLDVAISGEGFIAIQAKDGSEAYTRNGSFRVSPDGYLQTKSGQNVIGDGGPIMIPQDNTITIAKDGSISAVPSGQNLNAMTPVGRIKLVNPAETDVAKGTDGLFRLKSGLPAEADASVSLTPGAVESSNVNVIDAMTSMIDLARQYDLQIKMIQTGDDNDKAASQLINFTS